MRTVIAIFALLGLAACATPTPYQPRAASSGFGYTERQIETNRVLVTFAGNSLTERATVETYLLYRAAELTLQNGFDYFVVANRDTDVERRFQSIGGATHAGFFPSYRFFSPRFGFRSFNDPFFNDIDVRQITQFEATAEVAMFRGSKPAENPSAFNAQEVIDNLNPTIVRPTSS